MQGTCCAGFKKDRGPKMLRSLVVRWGCERDGLAEPVAELSGLAKQVNRCLVQLLPGVEQVDLLLALLHAGVLLVFGRERSAAVA
jgi:hypothetical protein